MQPRPRERPPDHARRLAPSADFAAPPSAASVRWAEADRAARPRACEAPRAHGARRRRRLLRCPLGAHALPHRPAVRRERGHRLRRLGQVPRRRRAGLVIADCRYTIAAKREAPESTLSRPTRPRRRLARTSWRRPGSSASRSRRPRSRISPGSGSRQPRRTSSWWRSRAGSKHQRQLKEPSELERVAAACAVADRALATLLPSIRPGVTEKELALDLEWRIRTGGADRSRSTSPASPARSRAAPRSPGTRPVEPGTVLLFDFGAQVEGYRSDMTRTLFVGEPRQRDLDVYGLVAAAQDIVFDGSGRPCPPATGGGSLPIGRTYDALSATVIEADGRFPVYGHGLGHGIGLATHELPGLGRRSPDVPLPRARSSRSSPASTSRATRRADRGPRGPRRRGRPGRGGHALPARRGRRRRL